MTESIKIVGLKIENVLGVTELTLDAVGDLVTVTGQNGTGKTSVLQAIALAFGGGAKDNGLLRHGAESGEVAVYLSDGTEIRRSVNEQGAGAARIKKDGRAVPRPEQHLKALTDALSFDPVAFLATKGIARVNEVLRAVNVTTTPEEVERLAGLAVVSDGQTLDLAYIDRARQSQYDSRRDAKVRLKDAHAAAKALEDATADAPDVEALEREIEAASVTRNEYAELLGGSLKKAEVQHSTERGAIDAELASAIDAAREAHRARVDKIAKEYKARCDSARALYEGPLREVSEAVAALEATRAEAGRAEQAREFLAQQRAKARQLQAEVEAYDAAVNGLGRVKESMLANSPLKGIAIRDGELLVADDEGRLVPFDHLNEAERVAFAVRLALLRSGPLKSVLVDGLEAMDPNRRARFLEEARKAGAQLFVAWADLGPFTVRT